MRIEHFLQAVNYQINESAEFLWKCFGDDVKFLDASISSDIPNEDVSVSCTFHPTTRKVFSIEIWNDRDFDYGSDNCIGYLWVDPNFIEAYQKEYSIRGLGYKNVELPLEEILTKIRQAFGTETEALDINIDPELHLELFKLAHERDISFNEYIVEILRKQIDNLGEDNE